MGILYSDVKYYRSEVVDFTDSSINGGGVGDEIINDTLHSIFPEISASQRESGVVLRAKIFVRNESPDRKMQDAIFYIKQDVQPEDRLIMYDATMRESYTFENTTVIDGATTTVSAGTSIEITNITPAGAVAGDIVGRTVSVAGHTLTIASSADDTHVAFSEDIDFDIAANATFQTNDGNDTVENDEDFSNSKKYVNSVIKSTVMEGVTTVDIPRVDAVFFEQNDNIIIVDEYFRAVYRGQVDSVVDSANENTSTITLSSTYSSHIG